MKTTKALIFWSGYVVVIFAIGMWLGVFPGRPRSSLHAASVRSRPGAAPVPSWCPSPEQLVPLQPGILAFDAELKECVVHEGEAEEAHFVFNLTNISRHTVIIGRVDTSCGCTVAKLPKLPWFLKPRAKGQIPVTMNLLGRIGKNSKGVTVFTYEGFKTLRVEANILPAPAADTTTNKEIGLRSGNAIQSP